MGVKDRYLKQLKDQYYNFVVDKYPIHKQIQYAFGIGDPVEISDFKIFLQAQIVQYELDKSLLTSKALDQDLESETVKIHKRIFEKPGVAEVK